MVLFFVFFYVDEDFFILGVLFLDVFMILYKNIIFGFIVVFFMLYVLCDYYVGKLIWWFLGVILCFIDKM